MNSLRIQSTYHMPADPRFGQPLPRAQSLPLGQITEPQVQFSGTGAAAVRSLVLGSLLFALGGTGVVHAQEHVQTPINEVAAPFIDNAEQMPPLNQNRTPLVDLMEHPLLSDDARAEARRIIDGFNDKDLATLGVAIIPNSHKDLGTISVEIFNRWELGEAGKNNGILLTVNVDNVLDGARSNRMFITPGHGLKDKINETVAVNLLKEHAVPHLQAIAAANTPEAKQAAADAAVLNTLRGIAEYMESDKMASDGEIPLGVIIAIVVLLLLLLMFAEYMSPSDRGLLSGGRGSFGSWSPGSGGGGSFGGFSSGGGGGV